MKYKILKGRSTDEIETLTNNYLSLGWQPSGSLLFSPDRRGTDVEYFIQPMIHHNLHPNSKDDFPKQVGIQDL